jgi:hypothetical protein
VPKPLGAEPGAPLYIECVFRSKRTHKPGIADTFPGQEDGTRGAARVDPRGYRGHGSGSNCRCKGGHC